MFNDALLLCLQEEKHSGAPLQSFLRIYREEARLVCDPDVLGRAFMATGTYKQRKTL